MLADGESIAADFTPIWDGFSCLDAAFSIYRIHMEDLLSISIRSIILKGRLLPVSAPLNAIPARQTRYIGELYEAIRKAKEARYSMRHMDRSNRPEIASELEVLS